MSALQEVVARVAVHAEAVHDDLDAHVAHGSLSVPVVARELQHLAAQVHVLARAIAGGIDSGGGWGRIGGCNIDQDASGT